MVANGGRVLDVLNLESDYTFDSRFRRCVTFQRSKSKPKVISELLRNVLESCSTSQIIQISKSEARYSLFQCKRFGRCLEEKMVD